jgi:hypothetical protein
MTGTRPWDGGTQGFSLPDRDPSPISDATLDALLSGAALPADPAVGVGHAVDVVAALKRGPAPDELAGEAAAMAEFRGRVRASGRTARSRRRRSALTGRLLSVRGLATTATAAITIGGVATAAYANVLPASAQRVAHVLIGAPAPQAHSGPHRHTPPAPATSKAAAQQPCQPVSSGDRHRYGGNRASPYPRRHYPARAGVGRRRDSAFCPGWRQRMARSWQSPGCRPLPHPFWSPSSRPSRSPAAPQARRSRCTRSPHPTWPSRPHRPYPTGRPFRHRDNPTRQPAGTPRVPGAGGRQTRHAGHTGR